MTKLPVIVWGISRPIGLPERNEDRLLARLASRPTMRSLSRSTESSELPECPTVSGDAGRSETTDRGRAAGIRRGRFLTYLSV